MLRCVIMRGWAGVSDVFACSPANTDVVLTPGYGRAAIQRCPGAEGFTVDAIGSGA